MIEIRGTNGKKKIDVSLGTNMFFVCVCVCVCVCEEGSIPPNKMVHLL